MTATLTVHSRARDEALDAVRARLHTFIKRRVESLDVADDLTQDVLLRLLMSSDGRIENPTAWGLPSRTKRDRRPLPHPRQPASVRLRSPDRTGSGRGSVRRRPPRGAARTGRMSSLARRSAGRALPLGRRRRRSGRAEPDRPRSSDGPERLGHEVAGATGAPPVAPASHRVLPRAYQSCRRHHRLRAHHWL